MSQRIIEWFWGFVNVFQHHTPGPISSAGAFVVNAGPTSCVAFSAEAVVSTGCTTADSEGAWVGAAVSCAFVVSPDPAGLTVGTGVSAGCVSAGVCAGVCVGCSAGVVCTGTAVSAFPEALVAWEFSVPARL